MTEGILLKMEKRGVIEHRACPLCSSKDVEQDRVCTDRLVSKEQFEIWQCNGCTFHFTQDAPDRDHIREYYKSEDYISHALKGKGWIARISHLVRKWITLPRRRRWVERLNKGKSKTLLDIGCGTGEWLALMKKHHWDVRGTEPDADARTHCTEELHLTVDDALEKIPSSSFDVITLWHVLEHMHSLHDSMEQIRRILKPDGTCVIAVPNIESDTAKKYAEDWFAYEVPRHLYHFSMETVEGLSKMHGFEISSCRTLPLDAYYICLMSDRWPVQGLWNAFCENFHALREKKRSTSLVFVLKHVKSNDTVSL